MAKLRREILIERKSEKLTPALPPENSKTVDNPNDKIISPKLRSLRALSRSRRLTVSIMRLFRSNELAATGRRPF